MNLTLTQTTIFNTFIKSDILTLLLTPPKNHFKNFKNPKLNATSQTPIQYITFHQYTSFTKKLYLHRYGPISTSTPHIFCTSKFELFDLMNPKIPTWQIPSLHIIPNPKWTKRAQKIPNQSSSWPWNCCTHTFGRPCLQVIWFGSHGFGSLFSKSPRNTNTHSMAKTGHLAPPGFLMRTPYFQVIWGGCTVVRSSIFERPEQGHRKITYRHPLPQLYIFTALSQSKYISNLDILGIFGHHCTL